MTMNLASVDEFGDSRLGRRVALRSIIVTSAAARSITAFGPPCNQSQAGLSNFDIEPM